MSISDNDLAKLYLDPKFVASFSGTNTFKRFLKHEFGIEATTDQINRVLYVEAPQTISQSKRHTRAGPTRAYLLQSVDQVSF